MYHSIMVKKQAPAPRATGGWGLPIL